MQQKDRLRRIFDNSSGDPEVVVIVNGTRPDPNFFYISGYRGGLFEGNLLFLFPDRHIEVLTNTLEEQAARQREDYEIHVERAHDRSSRKRIVSSILKGRRRVGVAFGGVSHKDFGDLRSLLGNREILDVSDALAASRVVKDADELETLAEAARIASGVLERVPDYAEEGMTERALKARIDYQMVEAGADSPSFETIVAFGENSAVPHHSSGERRLRDGDNVLVDMGARYRLYCSDITRTFFMGRAKEVQKEAYSKVLEAQTKAIAATRRGVTGSFVHQVAAGVIDRSRFKGRFVHGLGHSIGLEVHDGPGLSRRSTNRLEENMVLTVEPGIYLPREGGVRIEDDVVVTTGGCRVLTTGSREMVEI